MKASGKQATEWALTVVYRTMFWLVAAIAFADAPGAADQAGRSRSAYALEASLVLPLSDPCGHASVDGVCAIPDPADLDDAPHGPDSAGTCDAVGLPAADLARRHYLQPARGIISCPVFADRYETNFAQARAPPGMVADT